MIFGFGPQSKRRKRFPEVGSAVTRNVLNAFLRQGENRPHCSAVSEHEAWFSGFKIGQYAVTDCDRITNATNMSKKISFRVKDIGPRIQSVRGQRVILDSDLARIYGVPTKRLNEQVKRNAKRFPSDFMFQLTPEEADSLRSQIATLKKGRGQHRKFLPYAFTEKGAVMAANVLNSQEAVRMSIFVVRAFIEMRELLGGTKELAHQLAALEKKLTARLDEHEVAIIQVLRRVMDILDPPPPLPEPPRKRIGFHIEPEDCRRGARSKI